jgi:hypothetical protein
LVVLWEKLASLATLGDTRSFGTFYRVGFAGAPFAALNMDGQEFVYREPNLTKLPEITSRLVALWSGILGREVTVFKDSGVIDRASLGDAAKLQVTAVLPFFEEESSETPPPPPHQSLVHPPTVFELTAAHLTSRETHFERNTALRRSYYDTPYTLGGKSHGTVETQFKRRSMIALHATDRFPSFLRRLPVASRVELEMSPLQCVLEDIHKRIHKLVSEARPALGNPDLKTLTQVLSGSVNVQVNGGSKEICEVFLAPENQSKWDAKQLDELRVALGGFVTASGDALRVAVKLANEVCFEHQPHARTSIRVRACVSCVVFVVWRAAVGLVVSRAIVVDLLQTSENKAFIEVLEQGYAALVTSVRQAMPGLSEETTTNRMI